MSPWSLRDARAGGFLLGVCLIGLPTVGCGPSDGEGPDPCGGWDEPEVTLGRGVGGAFVPIESGEEVNISVAPQGGFGVTTLVNTRGLIAGDDALVAAVLDVELEGSNIGTFTLDEQPLLCQGNGEGGLITGVVVGFDPNVYRSNDDLLTLHEQLVDLIVTVTDVDGRVGVGRQTVTLIVGS